MRLVLLTVACAALDACATPHAPPEVPVAPGEAPEPTPEPLPPAFLPTHEETLAPVAFDAGRGAYGGGSFGGGTYRRANREAAALDETSALRLRLKRTKLAGLVIEAEESLRVVIDAIRAMTGLPLVVHPAAESAVLDAGTVFDFHLEHPISAANALDLVVKSSGTDLAWVIRHDAVIVTTKARARGQAVLRMYDIQTVVMGRTDFIGPRIDRLRLLDELEDDDGGGPFGTEGERYVGTTGDDVVTLVQDNVAPGTWDSDGVSIQAENGFLFVVHSAAVHAKVRKFLRQLGD